MSAPNQVIWKYSLDFSAAPQRITVPTAARVVHFAMQDDGPTIWMLVEPNGVTTERRYQVKGTGDPTGPYDQALYLGTTQHGAFVWHLFELIGGEAPQSGPLP